MKNKVVVINQTSGYLMVDTVNAFAGKYKEVAFICGTLGHDERPLNSKVKVDRIIKYNRDSALKRIRTWGVGTLQIFWKLLTKYSGYHVVYVTNPPMSYLCANLLKNTFSVIVYDIYPDALRNVGIKEGHFIYSWWAKQNRKLFAKAEKVYSLSDSMATALSAYMPKEKVKVIPLWPSSEKFAPIPKAQNEFAVSHGLQDKFVVMYSGNMGYTHSVDVLVDVAAKMKDNDKVHFLLVGGGQKKPIIEERVEKENLLNCTILDWQPIEVLPQSLATADLAVVTLNEESAKVSVPSKTLNMMAVGAPLMCISPSESEMHRLICKYENGACFTPADVDGMKEFIERLAADAQYRSKLSENSLNASKDFTVSNAQLYVE